LIFYKKPNQFAPSKEKYKTYLLPIAKLDYKEELTVKVSLEANN